MNKDENNENALDDDLLWQEEFLRRVRQGIEAADRGEFTTAEEVERVRNKYRPL